LLLSATIGCVLVPHLLAAQTLTGALVGIVKDEHGGVMPGVLVRVTSPALMGGSLTVTTTDKGVLRFPALAAGTYALDVELKGFRTHHEEGISIGPGATIELVVTLRPGLTESVVIEASSQIEARGSGFGSRVSLNFLNAIPTRRAGMSDFTKLLPGFSPTSPSSGSVNTVSAFGSGVNENLFLIDLTNMTCPCNGAARAEVGVDFIHEIQVQSVGASAEFGNMQGAAINVITKSGGNRMLYDASYYAQAAGLTSQPVRRPYDAAGQLESGYGRARYRDFTTSLGGPLMRDRVWFFLGSQYLRDYDSQPGSDPAYPRTYEQNKIFAKLTWQLGPGWQLVQSLHQEFWVNTERPTRVTPWDATTRQKASVPAMTFGHLTHIASANTLWDVRVGRFTYTREDEPRSGDWTIPGRFDTVTGVASGAPRDLGGLTLIRTSAKATLTHYRAGLLGADHEWKAGLQIERGEHHSVSMAPTGVRFVYRNSVPFQSVAAAPSNTGGRFITTGAFLTDALTLGGRLTINAGLRFDQTRSISQDLPALDPNGDETSAIVRGLGTLYTWNVVSPRLGVTLKLTDDGRTMLRASYGRFSQGVLTGELSNLHPGVTPVTTTDFVAATGDYTGNSVTTDTRNVTFDPNIRAPRTDEYSISVDREIGRGLSATMAYVRKNGTDFMGWIDIGGVYHQETRTVGDIVLPVHLLDNAPTDRVFQLTNPPDYSLTYNGLVMGVEKRLSKGWQASGSYTLSRASGLQASGGATAATAQSSTIAPPPAPSGVLFGRDRNDLTNARGRLPNDRPHMFRLMGSVNVPRTGMMLAGNLQYATGKPWAAVAQFTGLPQGGAQRVLLEPRGSRRLPSQTVLDVRVSRTIRFGALGRAELILDVLNALNSTAFESVDTDVLYTVTPTLQTLRTIGQGNVFIDPRRAMISVRFNVGR